MSGPKAPPGRRTLTPPVIGAAAFTALAALASVVFVTARGGLALPVAATDGPPVAIASPIQTSPAAPAATVAPGASPTQAPTPVSTPVPSGGTTPLPTAAATPSGPPDPLAALPACPDHPGCHLYTVRRGDTYSEVSDRYGVGLWIMNALNPEVGDTRLIVVGQTLYLAHDPTARLDLCPDGTCHLYAIRSGDTVSTIAGRYGLNVPGIEALNPKLDPARLVAGQIIRLPLYQPA